MKFSLAWTFSHIQRADWRSVDITKLVELFNKKTAEIERWEHVQLDPTQMQLGCVTAVSDASVTLAVQNHADVVLPMRKDAAVGKWFLVNKREDACSWTTLAMLGGQKEGLLAAIDVPQDDTRAVLQKIDWSDVIIEVDNKSITHRPDLWGHRGFAQEVALLLGLELKPLRDFVHTQEIVAADTHSAAADAEFSLTIQTDECRRLAALYLSRAAYAPSHLWMAIRLARIESKPINFLVDCTNYVMADIGHPMHAFDADKLGRTLVVRTGDAGHALPMLDGQTVTLHADDIVIADTNGPVSLAGVMGGMQTSITSITKSVLLEAAHFEPTPIRLSAARHKKRTDSSARFEKDLDPNKPVVALERYIQLLDDAQIPYTVKGPLQVVGKPATPITLCLEHALLQRSLGVELSPQEVLAMFKKLAFDAQYDADTGVYGVAVPSSRASKDITIPEDLIEEVGRLYGYDRIVPELPPLQRSASVVHWAHRTRFIKQFLSSAGAMNELQNLAFFDETFVASIGWEPEYAVEVQNPVSANWKKLVTTLIPGLLKAVQDNAVDHTQLRFFEIGRVWHTHAENIIEQQRLSGICYEQAGDQTIFYTAQALVTQLCRWLGFEVAYRAAAKLSAAWQAPYQTAEILVDDQVIGIVAVVRVSFLKRVVKTGSAAFFDLNLDWLLHAPAARERYKQLCKFPEVTRDLSILVPRNTTVDSIKETIAATDPRIMQVLLTDRFESEQWPDKRSLTVRMIIVDQHKTLTYQEIDAVIAEVSTRLHNHNVVVR